VADYFELTKPKVQSLLLLTTVTTMYVAATPTPGRVLLTCLGGYLSAGGAGAINHYWDRDIDAQMTRTANRPVPSGRVSPRAALIFGAVLALLSVLLLATTVNVLAAGLSLCGFVGYVGVYTIWLKRRTAQNIVIGGAAGAVPPLVGWAAATGHLSWTAVLLFAIVFYWTPPHFWALALLLRRQYSAAGVPMLPVVAGEVRTRRSILVYTVLLFGMSLVPATWLGPLYAASASVLGVAFLALAGRASRRQDGASAFALFHYSLAYLALLFMSAALAAALKL
jgi:protoheme IX farnesyltransferase